MFLAKLSETDSTKPMTDSEDSRRQRRCGELLQHPPARLLLQCFGDGLDGPWRTT